MYDIFTKVSNFISEHQFLIGLIVSLAAFFFNKWINIKAANPKEDIFDDIKPWSNALYGVVHKGIEAWATKGDKSSGDKLRRYFFIITKFADTWQSKGSKVALAELKAWFLSMMLKKVPKQLPNPLTEGHHIGRDDVAVEDGNMK